MKSLFEPTLLPITEKELLCRELLSEFGANHVTTQKFELIHSCILPFGLHKHGDLQPSAALNYELLTYKCLGCGMGGGLLWLIGTCRRTGSDEARKWLNRQTGINGEVMDLSALLNYFEALYRQPNEDRHVLPHYDARVIEPWLAIHPYLTEERGVPEENIVKMSVGYDPDRERIIFPHFEATTLTGWQARQLPDKWRSFPDPDKTKYRNSPDFPKDYTLYNYNYLAEWVICVESPMSVVRHVHHVPAEATFGASVTPGQLRLLSKHPKVILWFDNDPAGWKATHSVGRILMPYTDVWVVDSLWDADMGDMSDDMVDSLIRERSIPYVLWRKPEQLYCLDCRQAVPCDCKDPQ